jgi:Flp pilus assembly protein TadD
MDLHLPEEVPHDRQVAASKRAAAERLHARSDSLGWAKALDPLSVDPLLAQAALATSPDDIAPLRTAVGLQPGDSEVHYLLGMEYLNAHRLAASRRQLDIALGLAPKDPGIRDALRRARGR